MHFIAFKWLPDITLVLLHEVGFAGTHPDLVFSITLRLSDNLKMASGSSLLHRVSGRARSWLD